MFILELSYLKELHVIDSLMNGHRAFLEKYYRSGHFYCSGRKVPRDGGLIFAAFTNREEALAVIQDDPFYIEGAAAYRVIEFEATRIAADLCHSDIFKTGL